MTWELATAMNAVIALGYFGICATILNGLVTTRQLRTNRLAAATAVIFLTCAVHHGAHSVHMLLPLFGIDTAHGLALRQAFGWQSVVWDGIGAAAATYYLSLRRSYGLLLRTPAMFEDEVARRTVERVERERALLEQAEELAGAGSFEMDLITGRVTWSPGMYRIRKLAPPRPGDAPLLISSVDRDLHPDDRERVLAERDAALARGDEATFTYRIVVGGGVLRHLESRARIERDADGLAVRMVGVALDVTARREIEIAREQAERDLRAREQMLSGVIENNPALVYVKDLAGRYLLYNGPFAEAFALAERGQVEGRPAREVLLGRTDAWLDPELASVWGESDLRARLGAHRVEEWSEHPTRGRLYYDSVKFPILDGDGGLTAICGVSLETTDRKLLEAELRRSSRYFELSRDLVCTAGADGYLKDLNDAWTQTLGWSRAELRARPFLDLVHPDDREATSRMVTSLGQGDVADRFANRFRTREGDWRWLEWTALTEDGLTYASARDVTRRNRADEKIQRSEKLLADLLNSAPDAVVITDEAGRITIVNAQTERLFGYERDELLGAQIETLLPDRFRAHRRPLEDGRAVAPDTGPAGGGPDRLGRRKGGSEFPVDISLSAVDSDDGRLVTAFVRDITGRRHTENELAVAHDRALEASRLKSEFVANMSHEIRTPLNGVIGMGALLLDTELDDEQREYAEAIEVSADALMAVISDILDFSKIEAGKLELDRHRFDLRELVEGVSSMLGRSAQEKGLELIVSVADDLAGWVYGDASRIRQVLTNLLTNAVKFTSAGEVVVRATGARRDDGTLDLRFLVSDTGIGIEPAARERIFDAFSQADSSTTRQFGGTGLGLTISQQLAHLMGGRIVVESRPDLGSSFCFTVPVGAGGEEPGHRDRGLAGARVLVVDDNATNREVLRHLVAASEMACDAAGDADEAMRRLSGAAPAGSPYDLVIIDHDMPGTDGVGLATAVRAAPDLAGVRLLMLTSAGSGRRAAAIGAGVEGFVTKPVRRDRLLTEIARILGSSPAARRVEGAARRPDRGPSPSGPSILVAEDNAVNRLVATRTLEQRGCRVAVAVNGREAVEMHRRGSYDLIFMDCQMPVLDGYEATAAIRLGETPPAHTPIVAMTANTLAGDRERCLAAGMDDYVGKPLRPGELERVLARALGPRAAATPPSLHEDGAARLEVELLDPGNELEGLGERHPVV
jgi:PAS domain S-box-containing protein